MTSMVTDQPSSERLSIGYIAGAHGIAGDVRIQLLHPESNALLSGAKVWLVRRDTEEELGQFTLSKLERVPGKGGKCRGVIDGVRGREAAEALRGCTVLMLRVDLPALGEDEFYLSDAVGKTVFVAMSDGVEREVGVVAGIMSTGAQDLFEVEFKNAKGRPERWLLPVIPGFVREVDDNRILADVPIGMLPDELDSRGE